MCLHHVNLSEVGIINNIISNIGNIVLGFEVSNMILTLKYRPISADCDDIDWQPLADTNTNTDSLNFKPWSEVFDRYIAHPDFDAGLLSAYLIFFVTQFVFSSLL